MDIVQSIAERKERPAYVRFIREAVEDPAASRQQGRFVARDMDIAVITPPYSKDSTKHEIAQWFENMRADVRNGRMPEEWEQQYHAKYDAWKKGEEIPLDGVPIKGWAVAGPAQQEVLLRMGILTVEDLAGINDEGIRRIGMGGVDLKNKAVAWLRSAKDLGPVTQENAALKSQLARQDLELASLREVVEQLKTQITAPRAADPVSAGVELPATVVPISVSPKDQLVADYRAKFGRNPHPAASEETLRARLEE